MKLLLLFSFFLSLNSSAEIIKVKDKAYARQASEVYFESDIRKISLIWKSVDCLFSGTEFFQLFKTKAERVKAYIQIKKYLKEIKFKVNQKSLNSLVKRLRVKKCVSEDDLDELVRSANFQIEIFLQEIILSPSGSATSKVVRNLQKLLDVKYPIYLYE